MSEPVTGGGLAWPSHEAGPMPPPGYTAPGEAVPEHPTRRPLALFDRTKFLWAMVFIFFFLMWREMADNPLMSVADALRKTVEATTVLQFLFGIEVLRQLHYLVSEHSWRWHHLVSEGVFGRWQRWVDRRDDWTRYRAGRLFKLAGLLVILGIILGALWDMPWYEALFNAPGRIGRTLFSTAQGLPLIFNVLFIMMIAVGQFVAIFWFLSRGGVDTYRPQEIKTRFSHVWGQDPVLERVKENIVFLENPRAIEDRGGYVPGGILLWGPPGTGKTLMAEAVAGETGRPFVFVDPGAFINMFLGIGVLKVKGLFRKLRKLALRYGGVIVFFDEADTLGSRAGGGGTPPGGGMAPVARFDDDCGHWASPQVQQLLQRADGVAAEEPDLHGLGRVKRIFMGMGGGGGGGMGTLQALLTEMSGLKKPRGFINKYVRRWLNMEVKPPLNYRILVMMATNLPDVLDPALLRPGRIDRTYKVGYPSTDGREKTYRGYLAKIKHDLDDQQIRRLSVISSRATGASIKDIVNEALVVALRDGRDVVGYADVIQAKHLKTHGPADDWRYSDWEGHAVAVHEACHAVAMYRLKKREQIDIATIERRGGTGGFVAPMPLEDQFVEWRSELESEVMTFLASLAGERLFFEGDNSQGVGGDLRNSTLIVMQMTAVHGMGDFVASHSATLGLIGRNPSAIIEDGTDRQFLETDFGKRVEAKLKELLAKVDTLLREDRIHVLTVAHVLETHRTISGEDIVAVFEGHQGPLVDGGAYHRPEAIEQIEQYHDAVVEARRSSSRVSLPLPVFNGQRAIPTDLAAASPLPSYFPAGPPEMPEGGQAGNGGQDELAQQRALLNAIAQRLGIDPTGPPTVPPSPPLLPGPPVTVVPPAAGGNGPAGAPPTAPGGNGPVVDPHAGEPAAWPPETSPDSTDDGEPH